MSLRPLTPVSVAVSSSAAMLLLASGIWLAADTPNQNSTKQPSPSSKRQRTEEEEGSARQTKKVIHVDDDDIPAKPVSTRIGDLAALAQQTKNLRLRRLYSDLAVPHDVLKLPTREVYVEPLHFYAGDDLKKWLREGERVQLLDPDHDWKPMGSPYKPTPETLKAVRHYEQTAVDRVNDFLNEQEHLPNNHELKLSRAEQLMAAENVLSAAVRFHESARATGQRKGEDWEEGVDTPLRARLLEIRLEQLQALADMNDWDAAFELTGVLAKEYRKPDDQKSIARPLTELLANSLKSGIDTGSTRRTLQRLRSLQDLFLDKNLLKSISDKLHDHAKQLFDKAKELPDDKQEDKRALIDQAVEIWPSDGEMRTYQRRLMRQHPILRVGVRNLPEFLSPAMATTDSELQAVELLFESLVKLGVDEAGNARFVLGLAETRPQVVPLGRRFQLSHNAYWSNNAPLTALDVRATVDWLRKGKGNGVPAARGELFDSMSVGDPYRVLLPLQQGYLDPLSLMTFKILPQDQAVDSKEFAQNPVSSGPYLLDRRRGSENGREYVGFIYNPQYGARPSKDGRPHIREIRFFAYTPFDPKDAAGKEPDAEFQSSKNPRLDMLLDLTPEHAAALASKSGNSTRIRHPGDGMTPPTRRFYGIALNQRKPILKSQDVRRALAHSINREQLLDDYFRPKGDSAKTSPLGRLHAALNGPYPAGSWACNPKAGHPREKVKDSLDLFDPETAGMLYKKASDNGEVHAAPDVTLKYPDDDPALKPVIEEICHQLQKLPNFNVTPLPISPYQLRADIETGDYYLAYFHYDFPDQTYWLWPLLAPRQNDGMNIFGSGADVVQNLFQDVKDHRDFARVKQDTWKIHEELCRDMPFVPLWQLDPVTVLNDTVEAPPFDPLLVFTEVEYWKLNP